MKIYTAVNGKIEMKVTRIAIFVNTRKLISFLELLSQVKFYKRFFY